MKQILTLLFLLTSFSTLIQGQGRETIDSLIVDFSKAKSDTQKVNILNSLAYHNAGLNLQVAKKYGLEAYNLSTKIGWEKGIATSAKYTGIILMDMGLPDSALIIYDVAYKIYKKNLDNDELAIIHYNIGAAKQRLNQYPEAIHNVVNGIKYAEDAHNQLLIARGNYILGIIFSDQKNFVTARQYLFRAVNIYSRINEPAVEADNLEAIGYSFSKDGKLDSAKFFLEKGLRLYEKASDEFGKAKIYSQLSACYMTEPLQCIQYIRAAQIIFDKIAPDFQYVSENKGRLGTVYFQLFNNPVLYASQPDSFKTNTPYSQLLTLAQQNLSDAINGARRLNNPQMLADFLKTLSELQVYKKNYKGAYESINEFTVINDSLYSQENKNKIAAIESQREIELRDKQLELNKLALSSARRTRGALIAGAALLFIIGGLLFYQNRARKRTNTTLLTLNTELDEANKVKTKFFSILSHDLRSPVVHLINFLHLQKETPGLLDKERVVRHQTQLTESAENLLETMEAMLLWSKSQMERFAPQNKRVPVDKLFAYIKKQVPPESNIALSFSNPEKLAVSTDEDYLRTIMYNLTANAFKALAHTDNARIEWKARKVNDSIELSITDNGPGVHKDQVDALYNEQAAVGTRHGLGMHLIRDLAKAIQCKIRLDNSGAPGAGFTLQLAG